MALLTLDDAKGYLRVDSADEDAMIGSLLSSAGWLCMDVARLTEEQWAVIDSDAEESEDYSADRLATIRETVKVAMLYALGYLFEHREDADHHNLILMLRSLLFAIREGVV
jgi:hypothetical protein